MLAETMGTTILDKRLTSLDSMPNTTTDEIGKAIQKLKKSKKYS